jgi:prepilin-type processing-associated H-X9-DG protein
MLLRAVQALRLQLGNGTPATLGRPGPRNLLFLDGHRGVLFEMVKLFFFLARFHGREARTYHARAC